jgi:hypothetical protein
VTRPSRDPARPAATGRLRRLALGVAALFGLAVLVPASAVFAADTPNSLTIVGPGMSSPVSVRSDTEADLFTAILRQVNWMNGRTGDFAKPNTSTLGAKYTITIFTNGVASQVYEVYPQAAGGPRAHRPKTQPKGQVPEAWFYATVTLPTVLRTAGVPLPEPTASGQAGGVAYEDPQLEPDSLTATSSFSLGKELREARVALVATAATSVLVLLLLFGAARLSRRRAR